MSPRGITSAFTRTASVWAFRPSLKSGVIPKQTRTASRMHTRADDRPAPKNILVQFDTSTCSDLKCKSSQPVGGHTAEAEKGGQGQAHHRQRLFCKRHSTSPDKHRQREERTACISPGHTPRTNPQAPISFTSPPPMANPFRFIRTAASREAARRPGSPAAEAAGAEPDQPAQKEQGRNQVWNLPVSHIPHGGGQEQQAKQRPFF